MMVMMAVFTFCPGLRTKVKKYVYRRSLDLSRSRVQNPSVVMILKG